MSRRRSAALLVLSALLALPIPAPAATVLPANVEQLDSLQGVTQYRLKSNGMTLLLAPNHAAPVFTFLVVYHVGSRNEAPGNTGSAHLLEHMLFNKSTENFGRAMGHKTFQEVLFEAGADFSTTNMTTWFDRMNGYSTLPSDKLELAMRIEADRLARGLILDEERRPEMTVVRNEYEIGENSPYEALDKEIVASAIQAHPYHWSTIGYRSDIEGVSTDTLRQHYRDFFWPDNSEAILVGDFDPAAALALFDQQFGALPRSSHPILQVITVEPPQEGERRALVKRPGQVGVVQIGYIRPGALPPDFIPLDVLAEVLGDGINSRLHQALVERALASDATPWNQTPRDTSPFMVRRRSATASPPGGRGRAQGGARQGGERRHHRDRARPRQAPDRGHGRAQPGRRLSAGTVARRGRGVGELEVVPGLRRHGEGRERRRCPAGCQDLLGRGPRDRRLVRAHGNERPCRRGRRGARRGAGPTRASGRAGERRGVSGSGLDGRHAFGDVRGAHPPPRFLERRHPGRGRESPGTDRGGRWRPLAGDMTAPAAHPPSLLAADMVQRGTVKRDKQTLAAQLDGAGARLALTDGSTEVTIEGSALSRDSSLLLGALAEELILPAWRDDELAKAKAEEKNAILLGAENTSQRATERMRQLIFSAGHPYRSAGSKAQIASLERATVAELEAFHRERYVGSSLILSVVGDVDAKAVAQQVERLFGGLPKGARPSYKAERTAAGAAQSAVETMPGKANMNLMYGFASALRRNDPDYEAALLANAALGRSGLSSRVGARVRATAGLSYSLASRFMLSDLLDGYWMVNVAVAPANLAKAVHSTRDEIEKYCREGITEDEVTVQKNYFAGNFKVRLGNNAGVAVALATAEKFGYGPSYLDEFPNRIRKVTREQVNAAIKAHMHPERMNLVVAGDLKELPK